MAKPTVWTITTNGKTLIDDAAADGSMSDIEVWRVSGVVPITPTTALSDIPGLQFLAKPQIGGSLLGAHSTFGVFTDSKIANFFPCTLALVWRGTTLVGGIGVDLIASDIVPHYLPIQALDCPVAAFTPVGGQVINAIGSDSLETLHNNAFKTIERWQPKLQAGQWLYGTGLSTPCKPMRGLVEVDVVYGSVDAEAARVSNGSPWVLDTQVDELWWRNSSNIWELSTKTSMELIPPGVFAYSIFNVTLFHRTLDGTLRNFKPN